MRGSLMQGEGIPAIASVGMIGDVVPGEVTAQNGESISPPMRVQAPR